MEELLKNIDLTNNKWMKSVDTTFFLDSLTKVISRQYIMAIANRLIEENTPFTIMILDLDNFKQINDSFGHLAGDFILETLGEEFKKYLRDVSYVGRYGGDEFLIIVPNLVDYNETHVFLEKLYSGDTIFRKYYNDGKKDMYITSSIGCANYPGDATEFEELFQKADKALYRAKTKGRNCFVIYVDSKHKNVVVREKVEKSILERFNAVRRLYGIFKNVEKEVKYTMDYLYSELHCSGAYFLYSEHKLISNFNRDILSTGIVFEPHLELLLNGEKVFFDNPLTPYKEEDRVLKEFCDMRGIQSLLIAKVGSHDSIFGYIMIYENGFERIWQEKEVALVLYVAALLENEFRFKN